MELNNPMPKYNLFGVENPEYSDAKVVVLPVPYDSTTTYKSGARDGPHEIISASRNMETYSEEFGCDITERIKIFTTDELAPNLNSPEETVRSIEEEVSKILKGGKMPVVLGGEHTVAVGAIYAVSKHVKDFSVIHFDAHSDYRDEYMGSKYCHACIMARARERCDSCFSVGVRSIDETSAAKYGKDILYRKDMHNMTLKEVSEEIIRRTRKNVYITIDTDVIDPSQLPSTGTPEPDGLSFFELTQILKSVISEKHLVGIDFNELAPIGGLTAPNYLVAKLVYMALGYAFIKN